MGSGIRLGTLLGFEIRLDFSWFFVCALLALNLSVSVFQVENHFPPLMSGALGVMTTLLLFASVIVHELSHALVARRHGVEIKGITLFIFGGVAQIKGEPETPRAEFLIAGVGPLVSVALGLFCIGVAVALAQWEGAVPAVTVFGILGVMNLGLALFNLIPGFPLDGGRMLRSTIWHFTGDLRRATRAASITGQLLAWGMMAFGLTSVLLGKGDFSGLWLAFIGWYLNNAARSSYQQLVVRQSLSGIPVHQVLARDVPVLDYDMRVREFVNYYLLFTEHPAYLVSRGGELTGVVSLADARRLEREYWGVTCIGAIAHSPEEGAGLQEGCSAWEALNLMIEQDAARVAVLRGDELIGIVTRESLIRLVEWTLREEQARPRPVRGGAVSRNRGWAP